MLVFIAPLFTGATRQKQPRDPSVDEQIRKIGPGRELEYYSVLERREILTSAAMWMILEDIMRSEIT